ncbi:MAG: hypothetical protein LQ350_006576 [Teloschistes chrysophthalmus]|nr:MAG: hypothetical protein LQ350_006576 [Niorma chrysophthalma]
MDTSPSALLRLFVPRIPFLAKTALWHSLWLSPTSSKWDLRTEMTVRIIRSLFDSPEPTPISKQQRWSLKDPGIKGKMWISKVAFAAPEEEDIRDIMVDAIESMKEGDGVYKIPAILPLEAEWTGYRANVRHDRPRPDLSEAQHYEKLMSDVASPVTILYFHGGAHFMMDPSSHRIPTSRLAQLTGGRCLSVRYRLAPQNPFPCALLDAFHAYLSLLYPPRDSFHKPVAPHNIVFAGDSAGGNLTFALCQLILHINRSSTKPSLKFNARSIDLPLPLPAGVTGTSPWVDMTRCMPSVVSNAQYDYLPPPISTEQVRKFPRDELWPTDPPRGDLYCDLSMLCHPLVSPLAAKDWTGSCPMFFVYGEETLTDEGKSVASLAAQQGVSVVWEQFEAMPHCFSMIFEHLEAGRRGFKDWADFCTQVASKTDVKEKARKIETKGTWFAAKSCKETDRDVTSLAVCSREEVADRMKSTRDARIQGFDGYSKIQPNL